MRGNFMAGIKADFTCTIRKGSLLWFEVDMGAFAMRRSLTQNANGTFDPTLRTVYFISKLRNVEVFYGVLMLRNIFFVSPRRWSIIFIVVSLNTKISAQLGVEIMPGIIPNFHDSHKQSDVTCTSRDAV